VWGIWNGFTPRDAEALKRLQADPHPLSPTLPPNPNPNPNPNPYNPYPLTPNPQHHPQPQPYP